MALPAFTIVRTIQTLLAARKGLRAMQQAIQVLKVLAEIGPLIPKIGAKVAEALADGTIETHEVEQFAIDAAKEVDIRVKVHGVDVVSEDAEAHFLAFIGIVTANTVAAKKS